MKLFFTGFIFGSLAMSTSASILSSTGYSTSTSVFRVTTAPTTPDLWRDSGFNDPWTRTTVPPVKGSSPRQWGSTSSNYNGYDITNKGSGLAENIDSTTYYYENGNAGATTDWYWESGDSNWGSDYYDDDNYNDDGYDGYVDDQELGDRTTFYWNDPNDPNDAAKSTTKGLSGDRTTFYWNDQNVNNDAAKTTTKGLYGDRTTFYWNAQNDPSDAHKSTTKGPSDDRDSTSARFYALKGGDDVSVSTTAQSESEFIYCDDMYCSGAFNIANVVLILVSAMTCELLT